MMISIWHWNVSSVKRAGTKEELHLCKEELYICWQTPKQRVRYGLTSIIYPLSSQLIHLIIFDHITGEVAGCDLLDRFHTWDNKGGSFLISFKNLQLLYFYVFKIQHPLLFSCYVLTFYMHQRFLNLLFPSCLFLSNFHGPLSVYPSFFLDNFALLVAFI